MEKRPTGGVRRMINENTGASEFGLLLVEVLKGSPTPGFHYHVKRESAYIVVEGKAKVTIDDKDYIVEPETVVFISPGEKHRIENIGDTDFKMLEVYAPLDPDRVDIPES
jgi:mannose-6-phosphate isomerase-like protein (cupin superfamily)